ncbi:MAG TPA: ChbG/HpnK family deacetylase, partial [Stellaceae bacterium]|nr:ChbG/HpnK family deacetylase [Stellaceae bacterium]
MATRRLIVTADDFGRDVAINEAVEAAHRDGILAGASLMVGAPEAADAVERARRLPGLRVGLHLVLTDGRPVLPPAELGRLVGSGGRFDDNQLRAGLRYFFTPGVRSQLAA